MNIDNLKVTSTFKDDIKNHKEFCQIQLRKYLEGNIGYVTFLNDDTLVANIENDKYYIMNVGSETLLDMVSGKDVDRAIDRIKSLS